MPTETGHLVLADISGYTAFVAETELEHSREILNELLETLVRGLAQSLRIGQIEGDAIFALGPDLPEDPQAWFAEIFIKFHRHLNAMKRVSTCPCKACMSVGTLTLKFVCHWGEFLPQSFLGKETFVGNAVNQVHRLLKNKVPSHEYLLVTQQTMERLPPAMRALFMPHHEEYDLGAMECGWMDLAPLRKDPRTDEVVKVVDAEHAHLSFEHVFDTPKDRLWAIITDPTARQRWMGVQRVDYEPGAKHTMVGGEYHCIHGQGQSSIFRIMEATRPAQMTMVMQFGPVLVWNTVTIEDVGGDRTRLVSRYHFDASTPVPDEVRAMGIAQLTSFEESAVGTITREIESGAEAVAPA
jgi:uncharacterized protein YndB with AHSA1/START domain/class 3 adenylate cyclase